MAQLPHPLSALTVEESAVARDVIRSLHPDTVLLFRQIYLYEPPKAQVAEFLELEHSGKLTDTTPRPPRLAQVWFDVGAREKTPKYAESIVDIGLKTVVSTRTTGPGQLSSLIMDEIREVVAACDRSELFQDKLRQFQLPPGFEAIVEPWPYGASDPTDDGTRFFQGLVYAVNKETGGDDSNFYAYPIPLIPVMDAKTREIVRVLDVATGGKDDPYQSKTCGQNVIDHCQAAEYLPEKLPQGIRNDLKPLTVIQPEGASFSIVDGNRIEWQKWSMRLTFNPREGAVLHDIRYDGRSVLYRLSMSDMYFDGLVTDPNGDVQETKNVICLHEQDNGIGWKHTDWRTGRAAVTRRRELVVQYIITLANYEYVFNFKFDQAAGITIETRATGIVSVVNINPGQTAPWGNVVSPGALAQNHQHIFVARIDPAIDGQANTIVQEESLPVPMNPETNPHGNYYEVRQTVLKSSAGVDLAPQNNRVFKVQNRAKTNPVSGKPIGYKVIIPPTQLLLADAESIQSKRAAFANHHLWVTKYKEDELYAGGRYTLQSKVEAEGVADAAARADNVEDEDLVLWTVFGLTHNPRVEDWPVMPVETLQVHLVPSDFFSQNPAIDVPPSKDQGSKIWTTTCAC
ncbi:related to peroxisomal amine oxidase (copper-containing) [Cephalotrichum gorgonifer]|uniref:Amine oxidase n=1 Tax=Cephalotrichum gorgonifer TaxID=2041049 RepID=A0AAE8N5X9_9PEZI|nr:related to peroxisomal amine oxidase (copper-containing) [Cephalotrichum gorgonifer]